MAEHSRGHGSRRRLYRALLPLLAELGSCNAYAGITLPTPASVRLHQALVFEPVSLYRQAGHKFGAWHDLGWWQLRSLPPEPEQPRAWRPQA